MDTPISSDAQPRFQESVADYNCPYRRIVLDMPFPFALFTKTGLDWVLTAFNDAFVQVFTDAIFGQSVTNFPFEVKTARTEIEHNNSYYSVYSFGLTKYQMVVIMHNITDRKRVDDAIARVLETAVQLI